MSSLTKAISSSNALAILFNVLLSMLYPFVMVLQYPIACSLSSLLLEACGLALAWDLPDFAEAPGHLLLGQVRRRLRRAYLAHTVVRVFP
jgi:hypothetical protein